MWVYRVALVGLMGLMRLVSLMGVAELVASKRNIPVGLMEALLLGRKATIAVRSRGGVDHGRVGGWGVVGHGSVGVRVGLVGVLVLLVGLVG